MRFLAPATNISPSAADGILIDNPVSPLAAVCNRAIVELARAGRLSFWETTESAATDLARVAEGVLKVDIDSVTHPGHLVISYPRDGVPSVPDVIEISKHHTVAAARMLARTHARTHARMYAARTTGLDPAYVDSVELATLLTMLDMLGDLHAHTAVRDQVYRTWSAFDTSCRVGR
jgi:hypothetical protein